ncbi:MAG: nuclear transport factor 2 family protein [Thermoanaerobaculia bacterium]
MTTRALARASVAAVVLLSSFLAFAQEPSLKESLIGLEKRSWEAWQKRDGAFFADFVTDDHVDVHAGGPADKAAVVAVVGSPVCVVKSYSVGDFRFTQLGPDTALLVYHAEQDTSCGGNAVPSPSWVSSLYVRRNGRWKNALFQVSDAAKK